MDNKPKALIFGGTIYDAPLADISHLSEQEKKSLSHKASIAAGTYCYDSFSSDEEFEQAVACYVSDCDITEKMTEGRIMENAAYLRSFYYHKKKFRVWKEEVLVPMVKDMADYALHSPQYDNSFLLELERRKLACMDAYFSHSVTADHQGFYPSARWIRLCIQLLGYLVDSWSIPEDKIMRLNVRNIIYPVDQRDIDRFISETDMESKHVQGKDIYWHKAHRLYCHIREYSLHTWWD